MKNIHCTLRDLFNESCDKIYEIEEKIEFYKNSIEQMYLDIHDISKYKAWRNYCEDERINSSKNLGQLKIQLSDEMRKHNLICALIDCEDYNRTNMLVVLDELYQSACYEVEMKNAS